MPDLPFEGTVPANCGALEPAAGALPETGGVSPLTLALGGGLLLVATGGGLLFARTRGFGRPQRDIRRAWPGPEGPRLFAKR